MSYWDSSALVKLYIQEADSSVFEQFAASVQTMPVTSRLALYEIRTVLQRKEIEGALTKGAAQAIHQHLVQDVANGSIRVVEFSLHVSKEFDDIVTRCFGHAPPVFVRSLDGIHLASAIVAGETELVSSDKRLRDASVLLGFKVFPR
jgi:predicted nucleic acid-binding protein